MFESERNLRERFREPYSMRVSAFVLAAATALLIVLPASAFAQSGRCEELRLACEHKDQLGERGGGDCREYRHMCQRQTCAQLRYACLHKDTMGGEGQGYCERYRETCRR
jgi:hypothetical protein